MTHAEIKAAFMDERPVTFNGVRYRRVSALIYPNVGTLGAVRRRDHGHFEAPDGFAGRRGPNRRNCGIVRG